MLRRDTILCSNQCIQTNVGGIYRSFYLQCNASCLSVYLCFSLSCIPLPSKPPSFLLPFLPLHACFLLSFTFLRFSFHCMSTECHQMAATAYRFATTRCLATPGRSGRVRIRGHPTENWTGMFAEPDCQIVCNEVLLVFPRTESPGMRRTITDRSKTAACCLWLITIDGINGAITFQSFHFRNCHQHPLLMGYFVLFRFV
jgi:hypothetical protein